MDATPVIRAIRNRRRGLTLPMIRGLHKKLGIPADLLIRECRRPVRTWART